MHRFSAPPCFLTHIKELAYSASAAPFYASLGTTEQGRHHTENPLGSIVSARFEMSLLVVSAGLFADNTVG